MKQWLKWLLTLFLLCSTFAGAEPVLLSSASTKAIGKQLAYYVENEGPLSVNQAMVLYEGGQFTPSNQSILALGIGISPTWLVFQVENDTLAVSRQVIGVENSWLNRLDGFIFYNEKKVSQFRFGDTFPFSERMGHSRFFYHPHTFNMGRTTVLMRVDSPDPLVLPILVTDEQTLQQRNIVNGYTYGFLYGANISLLLFYLLIFIRIKEASFLIYSCYIAAFVITNSTYTGHSFMWFWPNSPEWQQWAPPFFMGIYNIFGYLFAIFFLELRKYSPKLARGLIGFMALQLLVLLSLIAADKQALLLLCAFGFVMIFSVVMLVLGTISLKSGSVYSRYFFVGSLSATLGASTTALTVWGILPFTEVGYRALEIGMLSDVVLLSLALAEKFKVSDDLKRAALALSRIDPLTKLYNRRGFSEISEVIWRNSYLHQHDVAVLLIDIDNFKSVNDSYGHSVGDQVIKMVAGIISTCIRTTDLSARWGGEEFIVLLPDSQRLVADALAEKMRTKVENTPVSFATESIAVSISIGVAMKSDGQMSFDELVSLADKCLYQAKHDGKNRVNSASTVCV